MQLRSLLFVVAASGCVASEAEPDLEILPDEPAASPDRDLADADDRTGSSDRAAHDESFTGGQSSKTGWAFGVGVGVGAIDTALVAPNTDTANPGALVTTGNAGPVSDAVLAVSTSKVSASKHEAQATAHGLVVTAGAISVRATEVKAIASATTTATGRSSSTVGSLINELVINGVKYGSVASAQTIAVPGVGEVALLARTSLGNGVAIDGIRIRVFDVPATPVDESLEVVVSHAEAYFPEIIQQ